MSAEARAIIGFHDFSAFRSINDRREDTRRTLSCVSIERDPGDQRVICWAIQGDHFLMHMVRIIIGTLIDIGRGRLEPGAFRRALTSCNRRDLGMTAPPFGLYLDQVQLTNAGTDRWPQVDEATVVT